MTEKRSARRTPPELPKNGKAATLAAGEPPVVASGAEAKLKARSTRKSARSGTPRKKAAAGAARQRRAPRQPAAAHSRPGRRPAPEPERDPGAEPGAKPYEAAANAEAEAPELREELLRELEAVIKRLRAMSPSYSPPSFSPRAVMELLERGLGMLPSGSVMGVLGKVRKVFGDDLLDPDTWKGIWTMLNYSVEYQVDVVKRRMTGDYMVDEWGLDQEYLSAVRPFFEFMYRGYWRVTLTGVENIPAEGRALLVPNHSGQLPWDAAMLATGVMLEHPSQRLVRTLYASWFPTLPVISDMLVKCGQVLATEANGLGLLEQDQLVAAYPEGYKGVGKLYQDRYRLARFGRGGFVRMALQAGAPLLPVAIVGAEETYISLRQSKLMARLTGFPYFPISPTWPWLGLLGFIPLPTKWTIDIGEPIDVGAAGARSADDVVLISQLSDRTRNVVQKMIHTRLAERRSAFLG